MKFISFCVECYEAKCLHVTLICIVEMWLQCMSFCKVVVIQHIFAYGNICLVCSISICLVFGNTSVCDLSLYDTHSSRSCLVSDIRAQSALCLALWWVWSAQWLVCLALTWPECKGMDTCVAKLTRCFDLWFGAPKPISTQNRVGRSDQRALVPLWGKVRSNQRNFVMLSWLFG